MKRLFAPHLGRHVVVGGRKRPKTFARRAMLAAFLDASALPTPPASTSYETKAASVLRRMFLNDQLGDCVCAGRAHRVGLLTSNAGHPFEYTDAQVLAEYERIGGYIPGKPETDQGCDMSQAADDGVTHGYADGKHDLAWIDIDATNKLEVMRSVFLFEHGDLGMELPDAWVNPFPSAGTVWDVAGEPNPENGHCVQIIDYTPRGVIVSTWGLEVLVTWEALAKYGARSAYGEIIVHLSPDEIEAASGRAPNAFDWQALVGYFNGMGGHAPLPLPPPPPPEPTPTPTPAPTPAGVTLTQAEAWVRAGLAKAPRGVITAAVASKLAIEGLAERWPK